MTTTTEDRGPAPARPLTLVELTDAEPGRRLTWLATAPDGGHPLGLARLRLFDRAGQEHLAELELTVHPAERGGGVGSRLLAAAVEAARKDGRRSLVAQTRSGRPGDRFLAARGFRRVLALTYARLPLPSPAPAELPTPGYRLVSWTGTVPDELAATFTASRRAMDDMPMDDTDYGVVVWDEQRVREAAEVIARRGELLHTVAAVDESDGTIVGFTELVVPAERTGDAQHYGTAVLPGHRRRGLARALKSASVRWALREQPDLTGLLTDTADSNTGMRALNDALGYVPTHTSLEYQLSLG
ncbi:GNAT family N-acetyltransferase [Streptomyces sp. NPDC060194]|uniref:GNAT family N-acetyltransferase n=1 Tax=Streptomyces sp. NPDC060194 TaxID=3347069 RepID=UPI003666DC89